MSTSHDQYHCRCCTIDQQNIEKFRLTLIDYGFKDQVQEDHGQVFGYRLRLEEHLQIHIKVMPSGSIESEMEPPPAYPAAHLNQEHSYSAHKETEQILRLARITYHIQLPIPETCLKPKIKKPVNPTTAAGFVVGGLIGIAVLIIIKNLLKDDEKES